MDYVNAGYACLAKARGQLCGKLFGSHGDHPRPPADSLCEGLVEIAACGERGNLIAARKLLDDGEGALADGASGTEDG